MVTVLDKIVKDLWLSQRKVKYKIILHKYTRRIEINKKNFTEDFIKNQKQQTIEFVNQLKVLF
jgi:hypothetical protein